MQFLWSCGGKFRVPLELHWVGGTHSCFLREVTSAFKLQGAAQDSSHVTSGMNRASSRLEAGTSWFLSISDIDLWVSVEFEQGRQSSSCVEEWKLPYLSSCE